MTLGTAPVSQLRSPAWDIRPPSPVDVTKAVARLRRYGQVVPLVVWREQGTMHVATDTCLLQALRQSGAAEATVWDLGEMTTADAAEVVLALEMRPGIDYARLAQLVASLPEDVLRRLPDVTPFGAERLAHFRTLLDFDWAQFAPATTGQVAMAWDLDEPDPPAAAQAAPAPAPADVAPPPPAPAPPPPAPLPAAMQAREPAPEPSGDLFGQGALF